MRKGFSEYEVKSLAEIGHTPESARKIVVDKLKKAGLSGNELGQFLTPIEDLSYTATNTILSLMWGYEDEPDAWIKQTGKDFSDKSNWMNFVMMIDS